MWQTHSFCAIRDRTKYFYIPIKALKGLLESEDERLIFFHLLIKEQIAFISSFVFFPLSRRFIAMDYIPLMSTYLNIYILKCNGRFNQTRLVLCTALMLFVEVYGVWLHVMKEIRKTKTFKISWDCWRGPLQWSAGEDPCPSASNYIIHL